MSAPRTLAVALAISTLALFTTALSPAAHAQHGQAVRDLIRERAITELRRPFERMTLARWRAVAPDKELRDVLVELTRDGTILPELRHRALLALSFFPGKRSTQVLWQVVYDREASGAERRAALHAIGQVSGAAALHDLRMILRDGDPPARAGAALGLGAIDDARVLSALENHLDKEEDLDVRLLVDRVLVRARKRAARRDAATERDRSREVELHDGDPLHSLTD